MADLARYVCVIGWGHEDSSFNPDIPYKCFYNVYNRKTQQLEYSGGFRIKETDPDPSKDFVGDFQMMLRQNLGCTCYRFLSFPSTNIKYKDIVRILINKSPSLQKREYKAGHRKQITLDYDDKYKWKVSPAELYEFRIDKDSGREEFDDFCDYMIKTVGMKEFLDNPRSANKMLREKLVYEEDPDCKYPDRHQYTAGVLRDEEAFHLNNGGRQVTRDMYEVRNTICVDVNSMYHKVILENCFSHTRMLKIPFNYTALQDLDGLYAMKKRVFDQNYGEGNYQIRCLIKFDLALARDKENMMQLPQCEGLKLGHTGHYIGHSKAAGWCVMFFEDVINFLKLYVVKNFSIKLMLLTRCSRFSKQKRQEIFDLYRNVEECKKTGVKQSIAPAKLLKNNIHGQYERNPMKHFWEGKAYDEYDSKNWWKNYPNICAGSEITHKGRLLHKKIEEWFTSKGLKVIYGNTDSLYIEYRDTNDRKKIYKLIDQWNEYNYREFTEKNKDLEGIYDYSPDKLIGGLKKEFRGAILHGGVNRLFEASDGVHIDAGTWSGLNWIDLGVYGKNIHTIKEGHRFTDVYFKSEDREGLKPYESAIKTKIEKRTIVF